MKIGFFLQLNRDLPKGKTGWKERRLDIPDSWRVSRTSIDPNGFSVVLEDKRTFSVPSREVADLSNRLFGGGVKSDEVVDEIWAHYEKKG
jgi:hypothetical protein